jgi:putative toxin-antitoxin system antitoxin component (TIGR02293 family)
MKLGSGIALAIAIQERPLQKKNIMTLARKFSFTDKQAATMIGIHPQSYTKMREDSFLSVPSTEMVLKLAEVYEVGNTTFENRESFIKWLNSNIPALNDLKPIMLIGSSTGIEIVRDMLVRIEYSILT